MSKSFHLVTRIGYLIYKYQGVINKNNKKNKKPLEQRLFLSYSKQNVNAYPPILPLLHHLFFLLFLDSASFSCQNYIPPKSHQREREKKKKANFSCFCHAFVVQYCLTIPLFQNSFVYFWASSFVLVSQKNKKI